MASAGKITIALYNSAGQMIKVLVNQQQEAGTYTMQWNTGDLPKGSYFITAAAEGNLKQTIKLVKQ